jgi:hypothetical protein
MCSGNSATLRHGQTALPHRRAALSRREASRRRAVLGCHIASVHRGRAALSAPRQEQFLIRALAHVITGRARLQPCRKQAL